MMSMDERQNLVVLALFIAIGICLVGGLLSRIMFKEIMFMTGVLGSTIVATAALADTIRIFWGMSLFWFFGITLYVGIIWNNQRREKANKKMND